MLNSSMREATGRVEIVDFSEHAVEAPLRLMYSGALKVKMGTLVRQVCFDNLQALISKRWQRPREDALDQSAVRVWQNQP